MRILSLLPILVLASLASCVTSYPSEDLQEKYAENATAASDWPLAARLWGELFLEVGDENPRFGRERGRALLMRGDAYGALQALDATLELFPDEIEALTIKASAHAALGQGESAAMALERRLVREPRHFETARALGVLRLRQGLPHAAIGPLRAALARARETGMQDAQLSLAVAHAADAVDEPAEALAAYIEAIALGAEDVADLLRVSELAAAGSGRQASRRNWLERACELDPQSSAAHLALGKLHIELLNTDAALNALRRAVEIDPTDGLALLSLAELYADLGDEPQTTALVERALTFETDKEKRTHLESLVARAKEQVSDTDGD